MNKQLVYIKDNIEKTHYIYTNELDDDDDNIFAKCYEWLSKNYREKYPDKLVDLRYIITNGTCDIVSEEEYINKGWIWNSTDVKRNVLYELTKIPVCVVVEKIEKVQKVASVQTEPEKPTQPKLEQTHIVHFDITPNTSPSNTPPTQKSFLEKTYNEETNIDLFNYFDTSTNEIITDLANWYNKELEPVISNISKLNLGNDTYGYAPNPFSPVNNNPFIEKRNSTTTSDDSKRQLTIELKSRLQKDNYGLRSKKFD